MEWFDFDDEGDLILKLFRQPVSTAGSIKTTCSDNAELLDSSDSASDTSSTAKDDEDLMEIAPTLEEAAAENSGTMVCSSTLLILYTRLHFQGLDSSTLPTLTT